MAALLGMAASSFLCPSRSMIQVTPISCSPAKLPVVSACQHQRNTVSRRVWAVGAASSAIALSLLMQPEAADAARRKPPPVEEEKKPAEQEEKYLSKSEQRAIANARRKENMKASVEAAKAKANSIASAE